MKNSYFLLFLLLVGSSSVLLSMQEGEGANAYWEICTQRFLKGEARNVDGQLTIDKNHVVTGRQIQQTHTEKMADNYIKGCLTGSFLAAGIIALAGTLAENTPHLFEMYNKTSSP